MMTRIFMFLVLALVGVGCAAAEVDDDESRAAETRDTAATGTAEEALMRNSAGETSCSDQWTACRANCGPLDTTCLNNCQTAYSQCKCGMDHCPPGSVIGRTSAIYGSGSFGVLAK